MFLFRIDSRMCLLNRIYNTMTNQDFFNCNAHNVDCYQPFYQVKLLIATYLNSTSHKMPCVLFKVNSSFVRRKEFPERYDTYHHVRIQHNEPTSTLLQKGGNAKNNLGIWYSKKHVPNGSCLESFTVSGSKMSKQWWKGVSEPYLFSFTHNGLDWLADNL